MHKSEVYGLSSHGIVFFKEVPEMLDDKVNGEEFTIMCAVSCLSWFQCSGEQC